MELFTNVSNNDYSVIQYTDVNKHSKLKLKYPLFKNDSIEDLKKWNALEIDRIPTGTTLYIKVSTLEQ